MELLRCGVLKKIFLHVLIILGAFQLPDLGETTTCYKCYDKTAIPEKSKPYKNCWLEDGAPTSKDSFKNPTELTCDTTKDLNDRCLLQMTLESGNLIEMKKECVKMNLTGQFEAASDKEVTKSENCYVMNNGVYEYHRTISGGVQPTEPPKQDKKTIAYCWCPGDKCNDRLTDSHLQAVGQVKPTGGTSPPDSSEHITNTGSTSIDSVNSGVSVTSSNFHLTALQPLLIKILIVTLSETLKWIS